MPRSYALKRDDNEAQIIDALERIGCSVWRLNGTGLPDLLVGRAGRNYLLEIKRNSKAKLTDDQVYWHSTWRGKAHRVETIDHALKAVEAIK